MKHSEYTIMIIVGLMQNITVVDTGIPESPDSDIVLLNCKFTHCMIFRRFEIEEEH